MPKRRWGSAAQIASQLKAARASAARRHVQNRKAAGFRPEGKLARRGQTRSGRLPQPFFSTVIGGTRYASHRTPTSVVTIKTRGGRIVGARARRTTPRRRGISGAVKR
jgi:hypothetical protein